MEIIFQRCQGKTEEAYKIGDIYIFWSFNDYFWLNSSKAGRNKGNEHLRAARFADFQELVTITSLMGNVFWIFQEVKSDGS